MRVYGFFEVVDCTSDTFQIVLGGGFVTTTQIRKSALNYAQISRFNLREKYFLVKLFTLRLLLLLPPACLIVV